MKDVKFSSGKLLVGDCVKRMREMPDNSVDSIVTDPPYELGFMGKKWDASGIAYQVEMWQECLRVLKPGGHLLAFGGTRTYHRMACAIEDAGFEIRDSIHWVYGSGFPKSLNVGKAIDKVNGEAGRSFKFTKWMQTTGVTARQLNDATGTQMGNHYTTHPTQPAIPTAELWTVIRPMCGEVPGWVDELVARVEAEREVVGTKMSGIANKAEGPRHTIGASKAVEVDVTLAATDEARRWEGWGTALKPAHEPVVVARKPLSGTVAGNVLEHGTGALNIDGCRVGTEVRTYDLTMTSGNFETTGGGKNDKSGTATVSGRWPANIVLDETASAALDQQNEGADRYFTQADFGPDDWPFVYQAKPSKAERNAGLDGLPEKRPDQRTPEQMGTFEQKGVAKQSNHHPTVKPVALMRHLVRLVTPPGGTVLDPFLGSGTTAVAAILEGLNWIGCEMTDDYLPIIKGRVEWAEQENAVGQQLTLGDQP